METTELTAPSLPPNLAQMCFSFAFGRAKEEDKHTITQPLHLVGLVGILLETNHTLNQRGGSHCISFREKLGSNLSWLDHYLRARQRL
jgi:hypothetical protein